MATKEFDPEVKSTRVDPVNLRTSSCDHVVVTSSSFRRIPTTISDDTRNQDIVEIHNGDDSREMIGSECSILSCVDREMMLQVWNSTEVVYPELNSTIHEMFEAWVTRDGEAVAIEYEGTTLTYSDLNARANRLAHYLRDLGVGPDIPVAICVERSLDMVVGVLGILKAGGAYLPLDPQSPNHRLWNMVTMAKTPMLLTQLPLLDRFREWNLPKYCLQSCCQKLDQYDDKNLEAISGSRNLAYILYTSGSTGVPKGVMNEHRSVINLLKSIADTVDFGSMETLLAVSALTFDISVLEIFLPLSTGNRVVIVSADVIRDGVRLSEALDRSHATFMQATPSMWRLMKESGWKGNMNLTVLCGGESLSPDLSEYLLGCARAVWNVYGPTETTIWSTAHRVTLSTRSSVIGRPLANTQAYVLDKSKEPLPIGEVGELFLGGLGVARGYLNQPELTAEKFLPDPFYSGGEARLYRTGDLAKWLLDGTLEFVGRIDHQIKLRGFRIELGEIETALMRFVEVHQAIVLAQEFGMGDMRLVAYVCGDAELSDSKLRIDLAKVLPQYMVPSLFVKIPRFPLTSSGKVDRKALLNTFVRCEISTQYIEPQTDLEKKIASIWCEILDVKQVGLHDNFFHLGGQSLTAARVVARLTETAGGAIPLRLLFEKPTIFELAKFISACNDLTMERPIHQLSGESFPLASFAQQRLWFLDQLEDSGLAAYNLSWTIMLEGDLSICAMKSALEDVVLRHQPLRTTFALNDGYLVQVINTHSSAEWVYDDLRKNLEPERDNDIRRLISIDSKKPFDLEKAPLLRARVVCLRDQQHVLIITIHHIAADGWSKQVFWHELSVAYQARLAKSAPVFTDLAVCYADYAVWQREQSTQEQHSKSISYWKAKLAGLAPLELPVDRPRPAVSTYNGDSICFTIPSIMVQRLVNLCNQNDVTLHMLLLSAFQAVLGRLTGRDDLAIAVPSAGRPHSNLEGLIGFFVNTLIMRADLSGSITFQELLGRTRITSLDAYEHQDVPIERLVEELRPERHLNRNALAQVMFQYVAPVVPDFSKVGLCVTTLDEPGCFVRFDLELLMQPHGDQICGVFQYSTDLFDRISIDRLSARYIHFLKAVLDSPEIPLSQISLLPPEEKELVLRSWNATSIVYPGHSRCLHELFEAVVADHATSIAVVYDDQELSYHELNSLSNRLARYLQDLGVGPDVLVGLYVERSLDMVIGLIAILKAGGAYLPLDPDYPAERLRIMVEDSKPVLVLTDSQLAARSPAISDSMFRLDVDWTRVDDRDDSNLGPTANSSDLAYVIYTAGSTGVPKGVMIEHRAICNQLLWWQQTYRMQPCDRMLQKTPISFDPSISEIFRPLLVGASLILVRPGGHKDLAYIARVIHDYKITFVDFVPSILRLFLEEPNVGHLCHTLKHLFVGGEVLSEDLAARCHGIISARLHNQYGPTEAAVTVAYHEYQSDIHRGTIPIGCPIGNMRTYILDKDLNPQPVGIPGELFLSGVGLARGYLSSTNFPDDPFINDPFAPTTMRMYRTGDRVKWSFDGHLEFLGRIDHQVKLRGCRIELNEIEKALETLEGIHQAVVVAKDFDTNDTRLIAYLRGHSELSHDDLRSALKQTLPEYMLPASFVWLESFVLTSSGKVDRLALLEHDSGWDSDVSQVLPRTELERHLAEIWRELLSLRVVGINDNFFQLGGHSLLAVRLLVRLEKALQAHLSLGTIFQNPTIAQLASKIHENRWGVTRPIIELLRSGRSDIPPLVLAPGIFGDSFAGWLKTPDKLPSGRAIYALRVDGSDPFWSGCETLEDLAEGLVTVLFANLGSGPCHLAGYSFGGFLAFEVGRQMVSAGGRVGSILVIDTGPDGFLQEPLHCNLHKTLFRNLPRMLRNLPGWLSSYYQLLFDQRWWYKFVTARKSSSGNVLQSSDSSFASGTESLANFWPDIDRLPALYRERGKISWRMLLTHQMKSFRGRLFLLRCRIQCMSDSRLDWDMGWGKWVEGKVVVREIAGSHSDVFSEKFLMQHLLCLENTLIEADMSIEDNDDENRDKRH